MITRDRLVGLLHYDPSTGLWTWLVDRKRGRAKVGDNAGYINKGYVRIWIDGRDYYAHRLAALYVTGKWPQGKTDHKNTNRAENSWGNLRQATDADNAANRGMRSDNSTGYKGVTYHPKLKKYVAQIMRHGKQNHLGLFATAEEAHAAYCAKARELFGEFARAA